MNIPAQPATAQAQSTRDDDESLARHLEATGNYKVLRRLVPRTPTPAPDAYAGMTGIILDFETTGLDPAKDEIIEVACVKFRYSATDEISGVSDIFQSYNEPSVPIPALVTELTGITNDMVAGQRIDIAALEAFVGDANIIIAHNAGFDRKFAERLSSTFEHKHWACTQTEIDWRKHGFGGAKLGYLLADIGMFHNAHRAIDDCHALVEILAHPLSAAARSAFAELIDCARRTTVRVWAQSSPFELKDALKARGYRWNDGTDGRPKSWFIDVGEEKRDTELSYLKEEIYQRDLDIECRAMTALERFSNRA
ncbi:MAG: 3'-5' exonuclease [Pseudolabrys sp.]|nr:3'-5' exonuclease [Pseudolabrys sp.]MDP2295385.1 3'-5' exonuclease [Pseudolabrys sp.]